MAIMGTYKYCGQSAGFFSRSHNEREEKYDRGLKGWHDLKNKIFRNVVIALKSKCCGLFATSQKPFKSIKAI